MLVSWKFSGPYGVTKYGSGWRKDVVNQCLEFDSTAWLVGGQRLQKLRYQPMQETHRHDEKERLPQARPKKEQEKMSLTHRVHVHLNNYGTEQNNTEFLESKSLVLGDSAKLVC